MLASAVCSTLMALPGSDWSVPGGRARAAEEERVLASGSALSSLSQTDIKTRSEDFYVINIQLKLLQEQLLRSASQ